MPHWKKRTVSNTNNNRSSDIKATPSFKNIIRIPGVKDAMICCFCYNAIEQTASLWSSSYLNLYKNIPSETAASYASMYFIGITIGRALGGFISLKLNHKQMVRLGQIVLLFGIILIILPLNTIFSLIGLIVVGLGTAPIYPSLIHSTGNNFGFDIAPSIVGIQMACSFTGTCFMPALFGLIADHFSVSLFPVFILLFLVLTVIFHERLIIKTKLKANNYLG